MATRSLAEIQARRAADEQEQVEHRAAELDRWHTDDVRREALGIRAEVRDLHR